MLRLVCGIAALIAASLAHAQPLSPEAENALELLAEKAECLQREGETARGVQVCFGLSEADALMLLEWQARMETELQNEESGADATVQPPTRPLTLDELLLLPAD